jgi:orotate phosphoribosyltransferase
MLVAEAMDLPFVYVRSEQKKHGLKNMIEGELKPNQKVVVVEDLISTGLSSLKAVDALRDANANVLGMAAIFTYGFDTAKQNIERYNLPVFTLTSYYELIDFALKTNLIDQSQIEVLKSWRQNPSEWGK